MLRVLEIMVLAPTPSPGRTHNVTLIPYVTLNLFQGPSIYSGSGRAARWTLKQVQGDVVGGSG